MKTLIIYISIHHKNTERIAEVIGNILEAKVARLYDVDINTTLKYDLIGFGSGIYFGMHHKNLLTFVDRLPEMKGKKAFIFSTSGMKKMPFFHNFDNALEKRLLKKGFDVVGKFSCRGWDTAIPFRFFGGISKNRPNKKDIKKAEDFANNLKRRFINEE